MELLVIGLFASVLVGCVILDVSTVIALLIGYGIFFFYALRKGFPVRQILTLSFGGVRTVMPVLTTFIFIGMLTATWRGSGCIPSIVCYASGFINPSFFLILTFGLCMLVSFLTGTSFGTSATMGVICMSIANSMNLSVFWVGGAILSGVFWGDRCSPVSTSALLVATITDTDLYDNIKNMMKSAMVPTFLTGAIYLLVGFLLPAVPSELDVTALFRTEFQISLICLLPAIVIMVLALCKVKVKIAMFISVIVASGVALLVQKMPVLTLIKSLWFGFSAVNSDLKPLINGGGLSSMIKVSTIVCIAACYADIFKETGLLDGLQEGILRFGSKAGIFTAVALVSVPASAIACNQTLATMLTHQLESKLPLSKEKMALYLEDSAIMIAGLIPWSIAGSVPLATVGATNLSMLAGCYLYLLPLWGIFMEHFHRKLTSL